MEIIGRELVIVECTLQTVLQDDKVKSQVPLGNLFPGNGIAYKTTGQYVLGLFPSMNAATGEKYVGNSDDSWATRSGFFRVNYSFADRYLLEVNGRYDLSSKFPKDDRSVFSPSFSLGWKLSEESWFKQPTNGFFDELKIRASYGSLANQALDNGWYAYLSNYGTGTLGYIMGGKQPQYVLPKVSS